MDASAVVFGWRTALLGAAVAQCWVLMVALLMSDGNRVANRWLAGALAVIAGLLVPYAIGFAGAYDAWPWMTFAPFAVPLALGPVLYLYARALAEGRSPGSTLWHLALPVAQWLYFLACFLLPMPAKWDWYTGGHRAWVAPVFDTVAPLVLAAYAGATWRVLRGLRARLADQRSDDDRFAARWLGRVVVVLLIGVGLQTGFWLWSTLTGGIDFFQETGFYLALGVLGVYLGIAGWRHAALPVPLTAPVPLSAEVSRTAPDWTVLGKALEARTRAEGWWREPDLNLRRLSLRMGTNTGRISRAINLGLGVNFSAFVNGLRAEAVAEALDAGRTDDLLDLALEMGFASKASFNRAFRARFGVAPSQWRRRVSDRVFPQEESELRRAPEPAGAG